MISRRHFLLGGAGVGLISAAVGVRHITTYPEPVVKCKPYPTEKHTSMPFWENGWFPPQMDYLGTVATVFP